MRCRDALLSREHTEKVRQGETGNRSREWPGPAGTGRETGLGHVRSDLSPGRRFLAWLVIELQALSSTVFDHLLAIEGQGAVDPYCIYAAMEPAAFKR